MTATETLRAMLDERGVEWGNCIGPFPQTAYNVGNVVWQVKELVAGLDVSTRYLTPEQAIEATLGYEPNDEEMLRLHDRLNMALLVLERNVDNGNERIAAIADAHELLEDAATLGRGTCRNVGYYIDATRFKCSECEFNGWVTNAATGKDDPPNYCPNCGRKVVDGCGTRTRTP